MPAILKLKVARCGVPMARWIERCAANLRVVVSNSARSCVCGISCCRCVDESPSFMFSTVFFFSEASKLSMRPIGELLIGRYINHYKVVSQ